MPHGLLRYQMAYFVIKCALSGIIIAAVSEVAKRSPSLGALIVSLPLVSLLGILWLWRDTGDTERIASHAESTWSRFLVKHGRSLRAYNGIVFGHRIGSGEIRDQSLAKVSGSLKDRLKHV
jgi:hypothetical protein